jgi:hypothetical protein
VENLETKQNLLVDALELWGRYVTALSADSTMSAFQDSLSRHFDSVKLDAKKRKEAVERLSNSFPAASALGAMDLSLVSSKLLPTFDRALEAGLLGRSEEKRTAAMFFLIALQPAGWAHRMHNLLLKAEPTWIVSEFVHDHCWRAYIRSSQPHPELLRLCKDLELLGKSFSNDASRGSHLSRYERQIKDARAKYAARHQRR